MSSYTFKCIYFNAFVYFDRANLRARRLSCTVYWVNGQFHLLSINLRACKHLSASLSTLSLWIWFAADLETQQCMMYSQALLVMALCVVSTPEFNPGWIQAVEGGRFIKDELYITTQIWFRLTWLDESKTHHRSPLISGAKMFSSVSSSFHCVCELNETGGVWFDGFQKC